MGGRPTNLIVSPSGVHIYVANWGKGKYGKIDIIDTATHRILAEVQIGIAPIAGAVSRLGDFVYMACAGSNDIWILDTNKRKVLKQIPVGVKPNGVAISPDGYTLYVTNGATNDLSVLDLLDLEETQRIRVGSKPFSVVVDKKGRIFILESGDNSVSILDSDLKKIGSFSVGQKSVDIDLSLDGRLAFVTSEKNNRLHVFEIR